MLPTITLISALHNAEPDLPQFFARVTALDHPNLQIVLVDDASTDATWGAVQEFAAQDPRVTALHNPANTGVGPARNRALSAARSDYIWFVDHDDDWPAGTPTLLARAAAETGADIVTARAEYRHSPGLPGRIIDGIDARRTIGRDDLVVEMLSGRIHGFLWSKLIRRTALGENPFPSQSSQSDFIGLTRAVSRTSVVAVIPDVVYRYLRRPGSLTRIRVPRLENLEAARKAMHELVESTGAAVDRDLLTFFDAWFYARASAFTPIRWNAPAEVRRDGIARAREATAGVRLSSLWRRKPTLAGTVAAVRYVPWLYSATLPVLLRITDGIRDVRAR